MSRRMYTQDDLSRIYDAALQVLGKMGMRVDNRECLEAMERVGCKVDYPEQRAIISPSEIAWMLEIVREDHKGWSDDFSGWGPEWSGVSSGTCPFIYDDVKGERRRATEQDCTLGLKIMETNGASYVCPPVSDCNASPKFEAFRVVELGIRTLNKSRIGATDLFHPEQIPFMMELGELMGDKKRFVSVANCPSSPLQVGKTIADMAVVKAPHKIMYAVPVMPVMGANAPMSPIGTAVVGVAEILGGYVLAKALNVETPVCAAALSALMDMKSGSMVYVAPEVFACDLAISETMRFHVGLPCYVYGIYIEAKVPGMRATSERLLKSMATGLYANLNNLDGSLDQGKLFSPTQMILDIDTYKMMAAFFSKPAVDEDSLSVDPILEIEWDSTGYMLHDHTVKHMRDVWESGIYGRAHFVCLEDEMEKEQSHLEKARQTWVDNLNKYEPPNHSDDFLRDLAAISKRAKEALG